VDLPPSLLCSNPISSRALAPFLACSPHQYAPQCLLANMAACGSRSWPFNPFTPLLPPQQPLAPTDPTRDQTAQVRLTSGFETSQA